MSEHASERRRWTLREFFDWAEGQDGVWELIDGFPVPKMMATPKLRHQDVAGNAYFHLRRQLREPCRAYQNASVEVKAERADAEQTREPDVLVDCAEKNSDSNLATPVFVVEVPSDSTRVFDLNDKLAEYRRTASIRYIVLIEARACEAQVYERTGDDWTVHGYSSLDDELTFEAIGASLTLSDLYENVPLPPRPEVVRP